MKTIPCAHLVFCVCLTAFCPALQGQSLSEKCENHIQDFAFARADLPLEIACRATGTRIEGALGTNPKEVSISHYFVERRHKENPFSYFATSVDLSTGDYVTGLRWQQLLEIDDRRFLRTGFGNKADKMIDLNSDSEKNKGRRLAFPSFDPFNLPLGNDGAYMAGSLPKDYVETYFVLNGNIGGAEDLLGGKLLGWWEINGMPGAVVDVTFDSSQGYMPVRVDWRGKKTPDQSAKEARSSEQPESIAFTKYTKHRLGGKSYWLPEELSIESRGCNDDSTWSSLSLKFSWTDKIGKLEFPIDAKKNWRNQVVELFDSGIEN